ncbi:MULTISPECIES: hypothetical protein [Herbaspirillum]|uniref:Conjugal transfer mating pair stabilization protein TraN n=1 Tax=Herbaspirillum huttiense TaxID=863372 RepID=A0AAJ2LRJ6_9BURK|nr:MULTISPECIES: hypothetical protein [Herbaspirillum]MDR9836837.1 hypothetical protein [Herbaspirillum huttiense]
MAHRVLVKLVSFLAVNGLAMACIGNAFADAHSDGIALGQSQLNTISGQVNSGNAQKLPFYSTNPPQAASFGGSSLFDVGLTRINTCKTAVHGSDPIANQECDAVNFLAKNPQEKVTYPINANDPIVTGIGQIINNASGSTNPTCTVKQTTDPDQTALFVCNEFLLADRNQCTLGRIVDVTANSNFQCNVTENALDTYACTRSASISVTTNMSCAVGSTVVTSNYSNHLASDPCRGGDMLTFGYTCAATDNPSIDIHILPDVNGSFPMDHVSSYHQYGLPLNFSFNTGVFGEWGTCTADVRGSTSCTSGYCSGSYSADIYYFYTVCQQISDMETDCNTYQQYSGTLSVSAGFQMYTANPVVTGTVNNCAALEARSR